MVCKPLNIQILMNQHQTRKFTGVALLVFCQHGNYRQKTNKPHDLTQI